jgi:ADP-heptose:LPS heptosyltransferase
MSKRKKVIVRIIDAFLTMFFWPMFIIRKFRTLDPSTVKRILVPEIHGLGDAVLSSAVFPAIKKHFPNASISTLVKRESSVLFRHNPYINEIITFDFPWVGKVTQKYNIWEWNLIEIVKFIRTIRQKKFDLLIDSRMDFRTNLLYLSFGIPHRYGYAPIGGNYAFTKVVPVDYSHQHRIDEWKLILASLGIHNAERGPQLFLSSEERATSQAVLIRKFGKSKRITIGIHPGGRYPVRRWNLQRFVNVIEILRKEYEFNLIIFEDGDGTGNQLNKLINDPNALCSTGSIRDYMSFVSNCHILLCNDGGAMHIADALGVIVVAIFGPGNPNWFAPYHNKQRITIKEGIPCRPCYDNCIYEIPYCIESVDTFEVVRKMHEAVQELRFRKRKLPSIK